MLARALEPEVMDTPEEAEDYDAMDHGGVNRAFAEDALAARPDPRKVLDVGTGTALIPIELCKLHPRCTITATDLAANMLAVAQRNVEKAGLERRIMLMRVDAKRSRLPERAFDLVMSNSIVHHIPEPAQAFADMLARVAPGGVLFVRDLERPADEAAVQHLVRTYASHETERARGLFEASLRAALTLQEVIEMARSLGIPASAVRRTSDRHWTLAHHA